TELRTEAGEAWHALETARKDLAANPADAKNPGSSRYKAAEQATQRYDAACNELETLEKARDGLYAMDNAGLGGLNGPQDGAIHQHGLPAAQGARTPQEQATVKQLTGTPGLLLSAMLEKRKK